MKMMRIRQRKSKMELNLLKKAGKVVPQPKRSSSQKVKKGKRRMLRPSNSANSSRLLQSRRRK